MSSPHIFIAVIGVTGAGKTSFISKATGREDLAIGHGIESCTSKIGVYTFTLDRKIVTLIDTPGFDDSEVSDADILKEISHFMQHGQLLNAVIYMQPINGNRCMGSEKKRTRVFKKILGPEAYTHVIIATTMWDSIKDETTAERFTQARADRADVWGDMVDQGARIMRHDHTMSSAHHIIRTACAFGGKPAALQLQRELREDNVRVKDTSAGRQLEEDLGDMVKKLRAELEEMRRERATEKEGMSEEITELKMKIASYESQRVSLSDFVMKTLGKYVDPFVEHVVVPIFQAMADD